MNRLSRSSMWARASRLALMAALLALWCLSPAGSAATITWRGTVDGAWNTTTANWAGGASTFTAGDTVTFDDTATGTTGITIASAVTPSGTVTISNTTKNYSFSGASGLVGNLSLLKLGAGSLTITGSNTYTGSNATVLRGGTTTISGNAIVTSTNATANTFNVGTLAGDNATLVIRDNASVTSNGLQMANNATSLASVLMQGGTFTIRSQNGAASNFVRIGASGTAVWNQTGGLFTVVGGQPTIGRLAGANGQMTVSSGTFQIASGTGSSTWNLQVGAFGAGTLTVSGNGIVETGTSSSGGLVIVAQSGTSTGVVNLDGGALRTRNISMSAGVGGASTFNFNGGTLVALASSTTFMQGLTAVNVKSGGGIIDTNGNAITIAQSLLDGGGGGLTKTGLGTLTLSGTNVYTGTTTISQGILAITSTTALPGYSTAGRFSVASGAGLALPNSVDDTAIGQIVATGNFASGAQVGFDTSAGDRTYSQGITGALGVAKTSGNTLTLSGSSSYAGPTTIAGGTLQAASATALGSGGTVTFTGGVLQVTAASAGQDVSSRIKNSASAISLDTNGQDVTFAGGMDSSNTGGFTKNGLGTLTFTGNNTYTGTTYINSGSFAISGNGSIASNVMLADAVGSSATMTMTGGTISATSGFFRIGGSGTGTFTQSGGLVTLDNMLPTVGRLAGSVSQMTLSSGTFRITGAGGAMQVGSFGAGTLTLSGNGVMETGTASSSGLVIVAQTGTGTGIVNLDGGTIRTRQITTTGSATASSTFNFNGGTLVALTSTTAFMQGLTAANVNSGGAVINTNGYDLTIAQAMLNAGGGGGLTKNGSGALTLSGNNTYTGTTAVNAGTLVAGNANAFGTGAVVIASGATLDLAALAVGNTITNNGGSLTNAANYTGAQTLSGAATFGNVGGSVTVANGGAATFNGLMSGSVSVAGGGLATVGTTGTISGGVSLAAGGSLGGSGSVGAISGAGLVGPGNSPGILTASSIDPFGGLSFAFEFTQAAPNYSSPTGSANDVLWLTGGTPFVSSLSSANAVSIYLTPSLVASGTVTGGFFTSSTSDFLANMSGGSFQYFVQDASGTYSYNGQTYMTLSQYDSSKSVTLSTVAQNGGQVMQMVVVPEPTGIVIAGVGAALAGLAAARRSRRGR